MNNPYQKVCKYEFCRSEFVARRTNQEYCCREHYVKQNNYEAKNNREVLKKDESILHKNRTILKSFGKKEFTVRKETLISLGFQFNYLTKILKNESARLVHANYEFYIEHLDNGILKISKNE